MKEATGELNSLIIVVIIIAALVAFFYTILWPSIKGNLIVTTSCSKAICEKCPKGKTCSMVKCHMPNDKSNTFECVWKG